MKDLERDMHAVLELQGGSAPKSVRTSKLYISRNNVERFVSNIGYTAYIKKLQIGITINKGKLEQVTKLLLPRTHIN